MLAKCMALELGQYGIRVNCINPTVVLTEMGRKNWSDPQKADTLLSKMPIKRFAGINTYQIMHHVSIKIVSPNPKKLLKVSTWSRIFPSFFLYKKLRSKSYKYHAWAQGLPKTPYGFRGSWSVKNLAIKRSASDPCTNQYRIFFINFLSFYFLFLRSEGRDQCSAVSAQWEVGNDNGGHSARRWRLYGCLNWNGNFQWKLTDWTFCSLKNVNSVKNYEKMLFLLENLF